MNIDIEDSKKIELFDRIAKKFFNVSFGYVSKSEIETFMFDIYLQVKSTCNLNDYDISHDLGITQSKARLLRIKSQLLNPKNLNLNEELQKILKNARYNEYDKTIMANVSDPNLFIEIENYLEKNKNGFVEIQQNRKILKVRPEYYIDLLLITVSENEKNSIIKQMKEKFKENNKINKQFDDKNIGKSILNAGLNIAQFLASLSTIENNQFLNQSLELLRQWMPYG